MKVLFVLAALGASCVVDAEVSAACATRHDVEIAPAAVEGDLPSVAWTMDVEVCADGD